MTPTTGSGVTNRRPPGIRTSAARVVAHARALARLEQELARTELEMKGALMGGGAATAVAAGLLLLYAIGFGLATVAAVLALVVDWWLALLIVFVLLLLLAIALAFASRSLFRSGAPLRPVQAIEEAQLTRETLRSSRAD
jgi:membrane protein